MSRAGLDNRHRNKDGEISSKHGNTLIRTLRKIYGQSFAAGYPETEKLREVLLKLNETWQGQDGQNETEQPNHSASLGDSITSSTPMRFSVHTALLIARAANQRWQCEQAESYHSQRYGNEIPSDVGLQPDPHETSEHCD